MMKQKSFTEPMSAAQAWAGLIVCAALIIGVGKTPMVDLSPHAPTFTEPLVIGTVNETENQIVGAIYASVLRQHVPTRTIVLNAPEPNDDAIVNELSSHSIDFYATTIDELARLFNAPIDHVVITEDFTDNSQPQSLPDVCAEKEYELVAGYIPRSFALGDPSEAHEILKPASDPYHCPTMRSIVNMYNREKLSSDESKIANKVAGEVKPQDIEKANQQIAAGAAFDDIVKNWLQTHGFGKIGATDGGLG